MPIDAHAHCVPLGIVERLRTEGARLGISVVLHDAQALRYLASRVQVDRLVLGRDDSFPPADRDPMGSLRRAGFGTDEIHRIAELNPRAVFRLP